MITPLNANGGYPLATAGAATAGNAAGSAATHPAGKVLDANSFITLLTAQLKAQDPLDPLKPQDMMAQLTSLNSLQELITIRQDLEKALGTAPAGGVAPASGTAQQ